MKRVRLSTLHLWPQVGFEDRRCPRCGSTRVHGHGRRWRRVRDWGYRRVMLQRLRCADCGATWSVYPAGVAPGVRFSLRAEQAMVLLYVLGLSYRQTAAFMHGLGVPVGASTVLRLVQAQGLREELATRRQYWQGKVRVRQVGVDGTGVPLVGGEQDTGVVVVVDQEAGVGLWVEAVDEQDASALARLLRWVVEQVQPEEVVSDEGAAYPKALEEATAEMTQPPAHRLCAAHFRRNKIRRLRGLQRAAVRRGWGMLVMETRALEALLRSPPQVWGGVARRWLRLVQGARPPGEGEKASWLYRYRQLLLELSEKAPQVTGVTTNRTEQVIGRGFKIRVKRMRGFKRADNRLRFLHLALAVDRRAQREGLFYLI